MPFSSNGPESREMLPEDPNAIPVAGEDETTGDSLRNIVNWLAMQVFGGDSSARAKVDAKERQRQLDEEVERMLGR